ncbi:CocE/NonD family hydrolase [Rhodopirellula sp. MGV]|uniref:CocE/NonD family hydrolase n=1 Tax=Rhodopirellula sp. MGV TaxID=2023130 RepID=UPI000B977976|nr:CocE/NonD family hydrolase [Rhodopirellula sp. MGV]OYP32163.1 acetylxylan esterase [Rhodopirellula sp. MGV]PNY35169.1 acetylxylan esterase [Rhodopirellula baltica]
MACRIDRPPFVVLIFAIFLGVFCFRAGPLQSQEKGTLQSQEETSDGDALVAEYFHRESELLSQKSLAGIEALEDWTNARDKLKGELLEMLGLNPFPPRGNLKATITGSHESEGVIVENVYFQSLPGLYVTANFYRPATQSKPLPAILYVCGHGRVVENGVSLGNKTHYQHHGAWYARNGFVCLVIDTIQLGEIEGIHHGTYREGMWWWNNRGYTPAGVEAFNGVRALDYLERRQEVDVNRIGISGRSGGGAYSWWVAAIDDRIRAAVPVAGITNLKNHVVDGCVEGHCDCMYMVNRFRWDFDKVAALIAPRPLLISNSDRDSIFPLDGVIDLHRNVRKIYQLYDADEQLGLHLTQGPHQDTQELRMGEFRFMNRHLRGTEDLIEDAATAMFPQRDLKVFDTIPEDEHVTTIQESFTKTVDPGTPFESPEEIRLIIDKLHAMTFHGWPTDHEALEIEDVTGPKAGADCHVFEYTTQSPYRLTALTICRAKDRMAPTEVVVLDQASYRAYAPALAHLFPEQFTNVIPDPSLVASIIDESCSCNQAFLMPRDVGPTRATEVVKSRTHLRRRYMLLGQTLAGMQIYDLCRGVEALRQFPSLHTGSITLSGEGDAAVLAAYASLMSEEVAYFGSVDLPRSNRDAPDLLNVSRVIELSDVQGIVTSARWPLTK